MIEVAGLRARYGQSGPWVLDGFDLQVPRGSLFGLLGPNGAGKTTLVRILLGLFAAQSGHVTIDGLTIPKQRRALARRVGLAPQSLALYPELTVQENLTFFDRIRMVDGDGRGARIDAAIDRTGLAAHAEKRASRLSGGLKQRLNLAIALLGEPPLLILDEPTVGVDAQSRRFILEVLRRLNESGTTIVYTTHYMDEVERLCDRVAIMNNGRVLVTGLLSTLLVDEPDLEALFLRLTGSEQ